MNGGYLPAGIGDFTDPNNPTIVTEGRFGEFDEGIVRSPGRVWVRSTKFPPPKNVWRWNWNDRNRDIMGGKSISLHPQYQGSGGLGVVFKTKKGETEYATKEFDTDVILNPINEIAALIDLRDIDGVVKMHEYLRPKQGDDEWEHGVYDETVGWTIQSLDPSQTNIVQLSGYQDSEKSGYIVMEKVPGEELIKYRLDKTNATDLSELKIRNIMKKVFAIVSRIHARGWAHRDLKLDNMIYNETHPESDEAGDVTILDFGHSIGNKNAADIVAGTNAGGNDSDAELTIKVDGLGTRQIMAPECFTAWDRYKTSAMVSPKLDAKAADMFALGTSMYALLSNGYPITPKTRNERDTTVKVWDVLTAEDAQKRGWPPKINRVVSPSMQGFVNELLSYYSHARGTAIEAYVKMVLGPDAATKDINNFTGEVKKVKDTIQEEIKAEEEVKMERNKDKEAAGSMAERVHAKAEAEREAAEKAAKEVVAAEREAAAKVKAEERRTTLGLSSEATDEDCLAAERRKKLGLTSEATDEDCLAAEKNNVTVTVRGSKSRTDPNKWESWHEDVNFGDYPDYSTNVGGLKDILFNNYKLLDPERQVIMQTGTELENEVVLGDKWVVQLAMRPASSPSASAVTKTPTAE
jgi:serine/threonine protein kinase